MKQGRLMSSDKLAGLKKFSGNVLSLLFLLFALISCRSRVKDTWQSNGYPPVYPDYINVTIPCNIAPLNFMLPDSCRQVETILTGEFRKINVRSGNKVRIPAGQWRKLIAGEKNGQVKVQVSALSGNRWIKYDAFFLYVSADSIDRYLSYRLIEPGYEVWNKLQLEERDLSTFKRRILADNGTLNGGCINCHVYSGQNEEYSFFHLREKNGGTMIQKHGRFRKLDTRTDSTISAGVYGSWHPSGRYIAFSTNVIIPEFHSYRNLRLEVFDTLSDVIVADLERNEIITSGKLSGMNSFETFPSFSADGKKLFFCSAKAMKMPEKYRDVKYSLCSVDFYPESATFGDEIDTLVSSGKTGKTLSEPKPSPDGRYILFTSFEYGNFPVWHREADLHLLNLEDMCIDTLPAANSFQADSYHSWSSGSRWIAFASKRGDGMYGRIYLAHVDVIGKASKAFVLPQRDPGFYEKYLKSFNIPELSGRRTPFNAGSVEKAFHRLKAEKMIFVKQPSKQQ